MSRANVVTKYICEYEGSSLFNGLAEEIHDLLVDSGVEIFLQNEDDYFSDWQINMFEESGENMRKLVAELAALPSDEKHKFFEGKTDRFNLYDEEVTNGALLFAFEEWLEFVDEKENVIRVHWF